MFQSCRRTIKSTQQQIHLCAKRSYKHTLVQLRLYKYVRQVGYIIGQLIEQIMSVVPLTVYLGLFLAFFYQSAASNSSEIIGGVIAIICGLFLFLEGIKYCCMPLGEVIGHRLPQKVPFPVFIGVCFALGILTTFAEPAISALDPAGSQVQATQAPYLYLILNDWKTYLILGIRIGVGIASAISAWRMYTCRPLLPQICIIFIPTIALSAYMHFSNTGLDTIIGLAWDCGAIATGPITASVILSLSSGIVLASPAPNIDPSAAVGAISLASLYPVFFVQLVAIIMSQMVTKAEIVSDAPTVNTNDNSSDESTQSAFMDAFLTSLQATLPLLGFLVIVLKVLVRGRIPKIGWKNILEDEPATVTTKEENQEKSSSLPEFNTRDEKNTDDTHVEITSLSKPTEYGEDESEHSSFDAAMARHAGTDAALHEALGTHPMQHYTDTINSQGEGGSYMMPWGARSDMQRYRTLWHVFPILRRNDVILPDEGSVIADIEDVPSEHPSSHPYGGSMSESFVDDTITRHPSFVTDLSSVHAATNNIVADDRIVHPLTGPKLFDAPAPRRDSLTSVDECEEENIDQDDMKSTHSMPKSEEVTENMVLSSVSDKRKSLQDLDQIKRSRSMPEQRLVSPQILIHDKTAPDNSHMVRSKHIDNNRRTKDTVQLNRSQSAQVVDIQESLQTTSSFPKTKAKHKDHLKHKMDVSKEQEESTKDVAEHKIRRSRSRRIISRLSKVYMKLWLKKDAFFLTGLLFVAVGLFFVNLGINYGLTPLGQQVGARLPGVFYQIDELSKSPVVPYTWGLLLSLLFLFGLGNLAARAEPALVVLGMSVEQLTNGTFSRKKLQNSVSLGAGTGILLGVCQILFGWPLLYILLVGYAIALTLTCIATITVGNAAWDSGGVTTGPVTVTLVLWIGISCANAVNAPSGFGILACASISPIAAVLSANSISVLWTKFRSRSVTNTE